MKDSDIHVINDPPKMSANEAEDKPADNTGSATIKTQPTSKGQTREVKHRKFINISLLATFFLLSILVMVVIGYYGFRYYNYVIDENSQSSAKQQELPEPASENEQLIESDPESKPDPAPLEPVPHDPDIRLGTYCMLGLYPNQQIEFYGSDDKYLLIDSWNVNDGEEKEISYTLFDGKNYYFWNEGISSPYFDYSDSAMTYTIEEAKDDGLDYSYQLKEVEKHPESCSDKEFDFYLLTPPTNIEFNTTQMLTDQYIEESEKSVERLCTVCLEEFSSKEDQLECFKISNIFFQQPDDVVEENFDHYCLDQ